VPAHDAWSDNVQDLLPTLFDSNSSSSGEFLRHLVR
jgi:hypothetical protein